MNVTIDSTNPRIIADNIRKLDDAVQAAASELPEVETTDEGKVLTVNSSGNWAALNLPPYPIGNLDYSETEQNTGVKWIDGKDVYRTVYVRNLPEITQTGNMTIAENLETNLNTISLEAINISANGNAFVPTAACIYYAGAGTVIENSVSTTLSEGKIIAIHTYTKPDPSPVPGTREPDDAPDAEPELKKATKKKTTKKEEEE